MKTRDWLSIHPQNARKKYMDGFFDEVEAELIDAAEIKHHGLHMPPVNIQEKKKEYKLSLYAPGFKQKDFSIAVSKGTLNITAARKSKKVKADQKKKWAKREFSMNNFQRSLTLPKHVDDKKIEASYTDGILQLTIPRQATPEKNKAVKKIKLQ